MMRPATRHPFLTLRTLVLLVTFASVADAESPDNEVRSTMDNYMAAALSHDGSAVAAWALSADRDELEGLGMFSVLHLRHRLKEGEMRAHSGRELLERSYDEGRNSHKALETVRDLGDGISMEDSIAENEAELEL